MKRFVISITEIVQLWGYADSWAKLNHPSYKRQAMVCKARALMYADRLAAQ